MNSMRKLGYEIIKRVGTALLTPLNFSINTGHFRSSIARKAYDSNGNPTPWYTFPAIDFLSTIDFTDQSVLEFGGGQSTIWWSRRALYVLSIDNDAQWFNLISPQIKEHTNVDFLLCEDLVEYANKPRGKQFDLIVIDGGDRYLCARTALEYLKERGAIVLDDSEGTWGGDDDGTHPIIELFKNAGFMRIDFYGYAPGVIKPHCTSIFFKDRARIFENMNPPVRYYKYKRP